jgi:hypothetical protein
MKPLLILVGLTGTGKTTTVKALRDAGLSFTLLPNRRAVTDQEIIAHVQQRDGQPIAPVTDRTERFAYTRCYRELYAGGMAYALEQLIMNNELLIVNEGSFLIFDGLRGENEVRYAVQHLPQAYFLFLDAPDFVRVQRLLTRNDAFDRVEGGGKTAVSLNPSLTNILTPAEQQLLLDGVQANQLSIVDIHAKLTIVQSERQNYDPDATIAALREHARDRLIYADTTALTPAQIAEKTLRALTL